jgi:hypothetical protein
MLLLKMEISLVVNFRSITNQNELSEPINLHLLLNVVYLAEKWQNTNFIIVGLTRLELYPTSYHTLEMNHYTNDMVPHLLSLT